MNFGIIKLLTAMAIACLFISCSDDKSMEIPEELKVKNIVAGGSGSSSDKPDVIENGSIRINNNSSYELISLSIIHNGKSVKYDSSPVKKNSSRTYTDIPVGKCDIFVTGSGVMWNYYWNTTITVSKDKVTTVNVSTTGWL